MAIGTASAAVTTEAREVHNAPAASSSGAAEGTVTLTLVPRRKKTKKKGVQWTDDTVDNEGMGRKSSKKCCIFHRRRAFGDWSDDEDSDQECDCPDPNEIGKVISDDFINSGSKGNDAETT